jgi:hypothetical protein
LGNDEIGRQDLHLALKPSLSGSRQHYGFYPDSP